MEMNYCEDAVHVYDTNNATNKILLRGCMA